jgi:aldose 1-epimerase
VSGAGSSGVDSRRLFDRQAHAEMQKARRTARRGRQDERCVTAVQSFVARHNGTLYAMLLHLRKGRATLDLAPSIGGGIAALRIGERDVLRPASSDALDRREPRGLAEFPLAPYVNRIRDGRFSWQGESFTIAHPCPGERHPLHGLAWQRAWQVVSVSAAHAVLSLQSPQSAEWPFPFELTRAFTLEDDTLSIDMRLRAAGDRPMPAAIGSHPYFPAAKAVLRARVAEIWTTSEDGIPVVRTPSPDAARLAAGVAVADLALDHCFTTLDGTVSIVRPGLHLTMDTHPRQPFVHIYTPAGANYFCVEPQSAMPDAVNQAAGDSGLRLLGPGATLQYVTRFRFAVIH